MTPWHLLPVTFALCVGGAVLSYSRHRDAGWAPLAFAALAAGCGVLWEWMVRLVRDPADVFYVSLCADVLMLAAYYVVPVMALGIRPSPSVMCGACLTVLGLLVCKLGG